MLLSTPQPLPDMSYYLTPKFILHFNIEEGRVYNNISGKYFMFLPKGWNKNEKFDSQGEKMTKKEGEKMWEGKDLRKKGVKEKKGE